jgi:enterochelin esterase family protein
MRSALKPWCSFGAVASLLTPSVPDPRNPATSKSNANTWSLMLVPGSDLFDLKDVPHGAVAKIPYYLSTLKKFRRMHVYTPPGYEKGQGEYPAFYLLHGAGDSDESWTSVGRAGMILDNLIAAGKAKPMIVVIPGGHTGQFRLGGGGANSFQKQMDEFSQDFANDVRPHVERNSRVMVDRANRAIASLSMGGAQTLSVALDKLSDYGYSGVFNSGVFGIVGGFGGAALSTQWEESHKATLDDADLKDGLKLVWFGCGKEDFLVQTSKATVDMLKKHKFDVTSKYTDGGHSWLDCLAEFTPLLFQENDFARRRTKPRGIRSLTMARGRVTLADAEPRAVGNMFDRGGFGAEKIVEGVVRWA